MASGSTTRRSLPYPLETDTPDVAADIHSLATALDAAYVSTSAGVTNITTAETRTNIAYGTLTTPDQVTGLVLPTNGLIAVQYRAMWQESVSGAASAAIFIGSNQLKVASGTGANADVQSAITSGGGINTNMPLASCPIGLVSGKIAYTGDVTTGQAVAVHNSSGLSYAVGTVTVTAGIVFAGGWCLIDNLPAGTYTISVQYKASSGSVTASNRRLRAMVLTFS